MTFALGALVGAGTILAIAAIVLYYAMTEFWNDF